MKGMWLRLVGGFCCLWVVAQGQTATQCNTYWNTLSSGTFDMRTSETCDLKCPSFTISSNTIPTNIGTNLIVTAGSGIGPTAACHELGDASNDFRTLTIDIRNNTAKFTGSIPASLGSISFNFNFLGSDNAFTGFDQSIKSSSTLKQFIVENNQITGQLSDYLGTWNSGIKEVGLLGNTGIVGNYNDATLFDFLKQTTSLTYFSISLTNPNGQCINLSQLYTERTALHGSNDLIVSVPLEGECRTPSPTEPPSTGAPVTNPPTPPTNSPSEAPTPRPRTTGPTSSPTLRPSNGPTAPTVGAPADRTLSPTAAPEPNTLSVVGIAGISAGLALGAGLLCWCFFKK